MNGYKGLISRVESVVVESGREGTHLLLEGGEGVGKLERDTMDEFGEKMNG